MWSPLVWSPVLIGQISNIAGCSRSSWCTTARPHSNGRFCYVGLGMRHMALNFRFTLPGIVCTPHFCKICSRSNNLLPGKISETCFLCYSRRGPHYVVVVCRSDFSSLDVKAAQLRFWSDRASSCRGLGSGFGGWVGSTRATSSHQEAFPSPQNYVVRRQPTSLKIRGTVSDCKGSSSIVPGIDVLFRGNARMQRVIRVQPVRFLIVENRTSREWSRP